MPTSREGAPMTMPLEQAAIIRAVALGLSAVIGFERQWRNRLASLRTNTLVSLGAANFVIFAAVVPGDASPTRVAAQVVSCSGPARHPLPLVIAHRGASGEVHKSSLDMVLPRDQDEG